LAESIAVLASQACETTRSDISARRFISVTNGGMSLARHAALAPSDAEFGANFDGDLHMMH
jgi:hypothetical protein